MDKPQRTHYNRNILTGQDRLPCNDQEPSPADPTTDMPDSITCPACVAATVHHAVTMAAAQPTRQPTGL